MKFFYLIFTLKFILWSILLNQQFYSDCGCKIQRLRGLFYKGEGTAIIILHQQWMTGLFCENIGSIT
jgi:hypothetical protein